MIQRYTIHATNSFLGIESCLIYSQVGESIHVDSWHTTFKPTSDSYEFRLYEGYKLIAKANSKNGAMGTLEDIFKRLDVSYENQFHLLKAIG